MSPLIGSMKRSPLKAVNNINLTSTHQKFDNRVNIEGIGFVNNYEIFIEMGEDNKENSHNYTSNVEKKSTILPKSSNLFDNDVCHTEEFFLDSIVEKHKLDKHFLHRINESGLNILDIAVKHKFTLCIDFLLSKCGAQVSKETLSIIDTLKQENKDDFQQIIFIILKNIVGPELSSKEFILKLKNYPIIKKGLLSTLPVEDQAIVAYCILNLEVLGFSEEMQKLRDLFLHNIDDNEVNLKEFSDYLHNFAHGYLPVNKNMIFAFNSYDDETQNENDININVIKSMVKSLTCPLDIFTMLIYLPRTLLSIPHQKPFYNAHPIKSNKQFGLLKSEKGFSVFKNCTPFYIGYSVSKQFINRNAPFRKKEIREKIKKSNSELKRTAYEEFKMLYSYLINLSKNYENENFSLNTNLLQLFFNSFLVGTHLRLYPQAKGKSFKKYN